MSKAGNTTFLKSAAATFMLRAVAVFMFIGAVDTGHALEDRAPSELTWFRTTDAQINSLVSRPRECLKSPVSADIRLGRLAFNSPRLLGGQAGRMGLSCGSCHRSGRGNEDFFIEQLSDRIGTADISHHFLSSAGGDQVFNPKPIPDLANRFALKVQNPDSEAFSELLVRLIEIEFDGQAANETVFESIRSYLRANDIKHCAKPYVDESRSLSSDWILIEDGISVLKTVSAHNSALNQSAITTFVASSMRAQLERFYRLYSIEPNSALDRELKSLSSALQRNFMSNEGSYTTKGSAKPLAAKLDILLPRFITLKQHLQRLETNSYYNQKLASQALMKQ